MLPIYHDLRNLMLAAASRGYHERDVTLYLRPDAFKQVLSEMNVTPPLQYYHPGGESDLVVVGQLYGVELAPIMSNDDHPYIAVLGANDDPWCVCLDDHRLLQTYANGLPERRNQHGV